MESHILKHKGSKLIKYAKNIHPFKDETEGSKEVATVFSGHCILPKKHEKDIPVPYACYTKQFRPDANDEFSHTIQALCIMRHVPKLKPYWPDVSDINYRQMMITTAVVEGTRLDTYLKKYDIFEEKYLDHAISLFRVFGEFIQVLYENKILHGDLQIKNIFIRHDNGKITGLKVIDFDGMRIYTHGDDDYTGYDEVNGSELNNWLGGVLAISRGDVIHTLRNTTKCLQFVSRSGVNGRLGTWLHKLVMDQKAMFGRFL